MPEGLVGQLVQEEVEGQVDRVVAEVVPLEPVEELCHPALVVGGLVEENGHDHLLAAVLVNDVNLGVVVAPVHRVLAGLVELKVVDVPLSLVLVLVDGNCVTAVAWVVLDLVVGLYLLVFQNFDMVEVEVHVLLLVVVAVLAEVDGTLFVSRVTKACPAAASVLVGVVDPARGQGDHEAQANEELFHN